MKFMPEGYRRVWKISPHRNELPFLRSRVLEAREVIDISDNCAQTPKAVLMPYAILGRYTPDKVPRPFQGVVELLRYTQLVTVALIPIEPNGPQPDSQQVDSVTVDAIEVTGP